MGRVPRRARCRPSSAHRIAKLQVTGPVTLAVALERGAGRIGAGAGVTSLARDVAVWLAANTVDQVRQLNGIGIDAVLVVDEPGLAQAGIARDDTELWDPLRSIAPAFGMHVCGRVPWDLLAELELDLLSFDTALHGVVAEGRPALEDLLSRGGRIAWGVIDPASVEPAAETSARAAACVSAFASSGFPVQRIAESSLLTPACGTGRLAPARERLIAATLDAAAHVTRSALAALAAR
jgi:hypothetical protein